MATYVEEEKGKKKRFSFPKLSFKKEKKQELVEADMEYLTETMKSEMVQDEGMKQEEMLEAASDQQESLLQQDTIVERNNKRKCTPEEKEKKYLFEKTFTCPVCGESFKEKLVRGKKAHLLRTDRDLRPIHKGIDTGKYDVIACPHCGYAALTRYFKLVTETQIAYIKDTITPKFQKVTVKKDVYTYADALSRYKLVLSNAIVKQTKLSEKAYICLKTAWILRGMCEEIGDETDENMEFLKECNLLEEQYLKQAYKGFMVVMETESFPMCGMDEATFHYLMAALAYREKQYDTARKMLQYVAKASEVAPRLQEKAEVLQELIIEK